MNPTTDVLEKRVAALEGGVGALAFSSGQAAQTLAILNIANAGDEIVSTTSLYGGTYNLFDHTLPKLGIKVKFCEPTPEGGAQGDHDEDEGGLLRDDRQPRSADPRHPGRRRRRARRRRAADDRQHAADARIWCGPIEHGADIVVHSLTKFIGGHGTSIGGIIVDGGTFDWKASGKFPGFTEPDPSYHGLVFTDVFNARTSAPTSPTSSRPACRACATSAASISPFNSFLFLQGIETLPLRMERHSQNAMVVARFLTEHPKVTWVNYPGLPGHPAYERATKYHRNGLFGAILGFGIKGGLEAGRRFIENVKLFSHLANVGDAKSLVIHPATTTHSQLDENAQAATGVTPDYVRLSVGLETVERPDRRPRSGAGEGVAKSVARQGAGAMPRLHRLARVLATAVDDYVDSSMDGLRRRRTRP